MHDGDRCDVEANRCPEFTERHEEGRLKRPDPMRPNDASTSCGRAVKKQAAGRANRPQMFHQLRTFTELANLIGQKAADFENRMYALILYLKMVRVEQHSTIFEKRQYPPCRRNLRLWRIP